MQDKKFRLVTKCDIDGLACGVLLKELDMIDSLLFAHPKAVEDGKIEITCSDITAGLPYKTTAHLAFDHYPAALAEGADRANLIIDNKVASTSRVIYNFYGEGKFQSISMDMLSAVDKGFSADISVDEIMYPTGWILLSYLIDQRTGLEELGKFSNSSAELIIALTDYCKDHTIWDVLSLPDVEERLEFYFSCVDRYKAQILRCSTVHYNLVLTDMREESMRYPGNRFMIYALFPECNVSLQVMPGADGKTTTLVAGKSIIDRSLSVNIGNVMRKYGGGGHSNAGTCRVENANVDDVLEKIISDLKYSLLKNLYMGYFNYYFYR